MYLKYISLDENDIFTYYAIIFLYTGNIIISLLSIIVFNINGLYYVNAGLLFTEVYLEMRAAGFKISPKKVYYSGMVCLVFLGTILTFMGSTMIDFWALLFPYMERLFLMFIATFNAVFYTDHLIALKKYVNNLNILKPTELRDFEVVKNNLEKAIRFFDLLIQIGNKFNRLYGFLLLLNIFANSIEIVFVVMTYYLKGIVPTNIIIAYIVGNVIYASLYYFCQSVTKIVGYFFCPKYIYMKLINCKLHF